jgi:hypothetical protein
MMIRFSALALAVPVAFVCTSAAAQTGAAPLRGIHRPIETASDRDNGAATVRGWSGGQSANQLAPRRDSLWNGTLVGAGLGALLGSVAGITLLDCSECAGFNVPLTFGVLGAGVGAGLGAGIDALHSRSGFAPPPRNIQVSPLITRQARGLVAWFRF